MSPHSSLSAANSNYSFLRSFRATLVFRKIRKLFRLRTFSAWNYVSLRPICQSVDPSDPGHAQPPPERCLPAVHPLLFYVSRSSSLPISLMRHRSRDFVAQPCLHSFCARDQTGPPRRPEIIAQTRLAKPRIFSTMTFFLFVRRISLPLVNDWERFQITLV